MRKESQHLPSWHRVLQTGPTSPPQHRSPVNSIGQGWRRGVGRTGQKEGDKREGSGPCMGQWWWQPLHRILTSYTHDPDSPTQVSLTLLPLNRGYRANETHWCLSGIIQDKGRNTVLPRGDGGLGGLRMQWSLFWHHSSSGALSIGIGLDCPFYNLETSFSNVYFQSYHLKLCP